MSRMPNASTRRPRVADIPTLGAGWHFPVLREQALGASAPCEPPGDEADDAPCLAMAADETSVRQAIGIVLSTARGERVMRPDFGCNLDQLLSSPNVGATRAMAAFEVREALLAWEPRIEVLDVTVSAGGERGEVMFIDIDYRVRSTDNRFSLVYPFYLNRTVA